ncbi:hypothetical protein [Geitlerinema sp. PCC 9228]|uniref:hypothetical protein n=1 Tax=Geitlerinema sp. PCC 9228 TaxID=111611 RepID=UPI0008F9C6C2|nr:hypothetical protein [Geitlerinema sp. PCC 9228]
MQTQRVREIRKLQVYIAGLLGIWVLFVLSFLTAWYRTSNADRFFGQPFHSFELDEPATNQPINTISEKP